MRCLALILALFPSAALAANTLIVVPPSAEQRPLGDAKEAILLMQLAALRGYEGLSVTHPKQLNRALEHYERALADRSEAARRAALAAAFGADRVIFSEVSLGKKARMTLRIESPRNKRPKKVSFEAAGLLPLLEAMPAQLARLLKKGGVSAKRRSDSGAVPSTKSMPALLKYAACHQRLIRQPIGIRFPVVLDKTNIDRAVALCKEARKLDPKLLEVDAALAFAYALKGDQANAQKMLATVKKSKKTRYLPLYWIGKFWALSRFHHPDLAARALREAIEQRPGFLLARGYLGDTFAAMKRFDDAYGTFEQYLKLVPAQPWVMGRLGYISAKRKDLKGAISWTQRALRTAPTDSELLLEMASRYVDAGEHKKAITILKRLIGEGAARGEVYLRLGYAQLKLGNLAAAEKELLRAIEKASRAAEWRTRGRARYDLAKLWAQSGLREKALEQLQLAVDEGYRDRAVFEGDPDFAQLKKDPRFERMLSQKVGSVGVPTYSSPFRLNLEAATIQLPKSGATKSQETVLLRF